MRLPRPIPALLLRTRLSWVPALLLIALWIPGVHQGWYRTDTHYYAAVALDAFERARAAPTLAGSLRALLFLQAAGEPYLNKPPLPFWIHGAFIDLFGLSLWSVRLPALLAAIGCAWAAGSAIAALSSRRFALVSVVVLATTVEFFRYTRAISLDLWMTLFMLIALALIARAIARPARRGPHTHGLILLSGVPLGIALLCKPVVALLCPALLALWFLRTGRARLLPHLAASVLIALAVAAPWHIAAALEYPGLFLRTYFIQQSLDRATNIAQEPWWFYARILAQTYWPWIVTAALAALTLARGTLTTHLPPRTRNLIVLAALWSAAWLVLLSLFGGKAPRYLLPVFPLLSVLSAAWLLRAPSRLDRRIGRVVFTWGAPAFFAIALAMSLSDVRVHAPRDPCWDRLLTELDQRPGVPLAATPREHSIAANLVMLGRPWPRTARDLAAHPPPLLLLHPTDSPLGPANQWRIIAVTREYTLAERIGPSPPTHAPHPAAP